MSLAIGDLLRPVFLALFRKEDIYFVILRLSYYSLGLPSREERDGGD
jgi:hypothetical protein